MAWTTQQVEGRHQLVLDLLAAHPLLSPTDLAAVLDLDAETSLRYLTHLERLGLVRMDAPLQAAIPTTECNWKRGAASTVGRGYVLTQPAVYLLATQGGVPMARSLKSSLHTTESMRNRTSYHPVTSYMHDVLACQRIAEHTRGVYTFFSMLHRTLRTVPCSTPPKANRVVWWETGRACMRHYRVQHGWHAIRPDGAAEVIIAGRPLSFWLEWDRSTMGLRDLRAKFTAYAEYVRSREWRTDGNLPLPQLLIVTSEEAQETRICEAFSSCVSAPLSLHVYIAISRQIEEHGPLEAIWREWRANGPYGDANPGPQGLGMLERVFTN
ncbi:MAG: replication-relaxation family protein [Ktedonobacterales bacterium]